MKKICSIAAFFLLSLGILLSIIDFCCFDRSFYANEYKADGTASEIGMSQEGLMNATDTLLNYLQMKQESIKVLVEVNGSERYVFNERETLHMEDVLALYQNALKVRTACLIIGCLMLLAVLPGTSDRRYLLQTGFKGGLAILLGLLGIIAFWSFVDFDDFWLRFHELFFDNDLYLLDPNTSIMINMFPDTFFYHLVMKIILMFCGLSVLAGAFLFFPSRYIQRKKNDHRMDVM